MNTDTILEKLFELLWYSALVMCASFFIHRFGSDVWGFAYPLSAIVIAFFLCHVVLTITQYKGIALYVRAGIPSFIVLYIWRQGEFAEGIVPAFQDSVGMQSTLLFLLSTVLSICAAEYFQVPVSHIKETTQRDQVSTASVAIRGSTSFSDIIGQDHVLEPLKEIARLSAAQIRVGKENAPYAVLFFLGPTGVGKTEAARALASAVYGTQDALIRFDMGQFSDPHQASRFYGPPPGYVGYEQGGQLTRAVMKKPRAVVLLDEVEKADPKIWDAFLPVFDEGYIVDGSSNKKVDMRQTIIVLTSNLLSDQPEIFSKSPSELKDALQRSGVFRPELVGRINEILVFKALEKTTIREILQRRIDNALWSLSAQGHSISIDPSEVDEMVEEIQAAKFGVRQIDDVLRAKLRKHLAQQAVTDSISID